METTMNRSTKKFIRLQKSLIRKQFSDTKKQEEMIAALYQKAVATPAATPAMEQKPEKKVEKEKKAEVKAGAKKKETKKAKKNEAK